VRRLIDETPQVTQTQMTMRIITLAGLVLLAMPVSGDDRVAEQVRATYQERITDQSTTTSRTLALVDCIQIALQHNLDVQITQLEPELAEFTLRGSYGSYDPNLSLSARHSYESSPGGIDDQGRSFSGTESETDSYSGSLGGLLPWGTRYTLGASLSDRYGSQPSFTRDLGNPLTVVTNQYFDLVNNVPVTQVITNYGSLPSRSPFERANANLGFFELRQPLLKNFLIDSPRLQIALNKKSLRISELGLRAQVINTITAVEEAYYNLIYAEETVKVQEKALELAERLVAENRRRVEVGALAPLDERQAESQAATTRADLLAARANRDTQQRVLKSLLSDDYSEWQYTRIEPTETLSVVPQALVLQESWRKGLSQRPDLLQAQLNLERQEDIVRFQRNQRYPQVDLVGDVGYLGSDDDFNSAFRQVRQQDNPYYSYGVQVTIPLGNTTARNSLKAAKSTREQLELQFKQLEQTALISIENAIASARTSLERVEATRQARLFAEEALRAENTKLEKGKSTSFVVLQLQRDLTSARSTEIRALADYNIALARLASSEGSTLDRRGVTLKLK
jgi:outer membrane protein TolC